MFYVGLFEKKKRPCTVPGTRSSLRFNHTINHTKLRNPKVINRQLATCRVYKVIVSRETLISSSLKFFLVFACILYYHSGGWTPACFPIVLELLSFVNQIRGNSRFPKIVVN